MILIYVEIGVYYKSEIFQERQKTVYRPIEVDVCACLVHSFVQLPVRLFIHNVPQSFGNTEFYQLM